MPSLKKRYGYDFDCLKPKHSQILLSSGTSFVMLEIVRIDSFLVLKPIIHLSVQILREIIGMFIL
jgi:hypothetical protein